MSDLRRFHNALRILLNINLSELKAAGVELEKFEWYRFADNPWRWFIKASDENAAKVWAIIEARQPK